MENSFKKFKYTEMCLEEFLNLPKKCQQLFMLLFLQNKNTFYPRVFEDIGIKSPIEKIFISAFDLYLELENKENIFLSSQKEIICNNKTYYADFCYDADDYLSQLNFKEKLKNSNFKLIIECDGHDFHEKTKEQVKKDNERQLDLKMAGYDVLRFSGTQIYNEPLNCAKNTYDYIIKKIQEV